MDEKLLKIIQQNRDHILVSWSYSIHSLSDRYRNRPIEELKLNISRHLDAIMEYIKTGRRKSLENFLVELADLRGSLDFSLRETQNAMLTGKGIILDLLERSIKTVPQLMKSLRILENCFNETINIYSEIFQNMQKDRKILDDLASGIGAGLYILDKDMNVVWANKKITDMYGTLEVIKGKPCYQIFRENPSICDNCLSEKAFISGKIEVGRRTSIDRFGEERFYHLVAAPVKDSSDKVIRVLQLMLDLTEARELEKRAEQTEQILKNILRESADAIIGIDSRNCIVSWNKGAELIFGYAENEILGKPLDILIPPGDKHSREQEELRKEVRKHGFIKNFEAEMLTRSGNRVILSLTKSAIRDYNGNIIGSSIIARDITEVKGLEHQLRQSERLAVMGQLAAGIAHEVGNPLTSISSIVQVLQRKNSDRFYQSQLSTIRDHIDRINKIVRELVDFARPAQFELVSTDVNDVIRSALGIVRYDKRSKNIDFKIKFHEALPNVKADPDQLLQVFTNIMMNAIDAMEVKGGVLTVMTSVLNRRVRAEFEDTGVGMSREVMKKIFDPFFSTKEVGKGTGLGLSVSYKIIENLNGTIEVKSREGYGSKFIVSIPVNSEE